jgi:hypothetical protein
MLKRLLDLPESYAGMDRSHRPGGQIESAGVDQGFGSRSRSNRNSYAATAGWEMGPFRN